MFKAVDVLVCIAAFSEVPAVSSVAGRFHLRTSWRNYPPALFVALLFFYVSLVSWGARLAYGL
jgi:hypothetical protein